jgi:hypothetical protein
MWTRPRALGKQVHSNFAVYSLQCSTGCESLGGSGGGGGGGERL